MKTIIQYFNITLRSGIFTMAGIMLITILLTGCSQHKNALVNKAFHNTTARYNAYFLARERMKEVERKIAEGHVDDYNKILTIYPLVNESSQGAIKSDLEYIITKAALPINKHQNSKWVDDSYNLIGKARLYQKEYALATRTFKYVNTKSEDKVARHEAMILLLRAYLDSLQIESARATNEYLGKEKITEVNAAELYLAKAALYQAEEDFPKTRMSLETALPYLKKSDRKARTHFIIGQIYQMEGNDQKAYESYMNVFKNNPPYELFFYARLYIAQVSSLAASDQKKIDKYFRKLLKDQKNLEYRDKIYYEKGKYELKNNRLPEAITNFETSIMENKANQFQKARSYLALANIYYDRLQKFQLSKLYFDSTVTLWDQKDKDYEWIENRQKILTEFVGYYETVQREDSLQRLAKMDSVSLSRLIDEIIEQEELAERERVRKEALAEKRRQQSLAIEQDQDQFPQLNTPNRGPQVWYFYNTTLVAKGKTEFRKLWGNRPLEDNWRRSNKQSMISFDVPETIEEIEEVDIDNTQDSLLALKARKETMYSAIPFSKQDLDSSNARLEDGLFNLGKIYNQKLLEQDNSIASFIQLIERFPQSELKPEVYYFLYLIYKSLNDEQYLVYQNLLFDEFPQSTYSKLIKNPNYLVESKITNQKAEAIYKQAFALYKGGMYISSDSLLSTINVLYPDNDIQDKIALLSVQNKGKTVNPYLYTKYLEEFVERNPNSSLIPAANDLIDKTKDYIERQKESGIALENQTKYMRSFNRPHSFVVMYSANQLNGDRLKTELAKYNTLKKYSISTPEDKNLFENSVALYITGFPDKDSAKKYMDQLCEKDKLLSKYGNSCTPFIISSDNFVILERSGDLTSYMDFFKKNYNDRLIYGE